MLATNFNHFIVFYTIEDGGFSNLQHMIGYEDMPTIEDIFNGLLEFKTDVFPKLDLNSGVYMVQLDRQTVMDYFFGGSA